MTGRQLAHYSVGEKIGEGGMGVVYKGTDTRLKRTIALKFLTRALPEDAFERKRFLREARAASAVNHPNVCVIHAIEEVAGEEFIVMEFVEGMTLRKWANSRRAEGKGGVVPVRDVLAIAAQVAGGLDAAHRHGIVHRDVKPENVMITPDGRAKIMDFGLAKLAGESKLTRTGATVGTVAYMSPEQVQGGEIDAQSDIYSFGVLLYELLTGSTPFQADHVMGMMYAIVSTEPPPPGKLRPGIDPGLARIVMKCMAKEKRGRYPTMRGVIEDVLAFEEWDKTSLAPVVRGRRKRSFPAQGTQLAAFLRRKPIPAAAAGALFIAVAVFILQRGVTTDGAHTFTQDSLIRGEAPRSDSLRSSQGAGIDTTGLRQAAGSDSAGLPEITKPKAGPARPLTVDDLATELVTRLQQNAGAVTGPVTVIPFTFQDTQTGSAFSRFFQSLLESRIAALTRWQVAAARELRIGEEQSGERATGFQVTGTYWQQAREMRFFARLNNRRTGENVAQAEASLAGDAMAKQGLPWKPENLRQVVDNARKLGTQGPETGDLKLELLTNRGTDNPMFTEGDTLRTFVRVNRPCTVRVFYHSADSTHYVLTGPNDLTIGSSRVNRLVPVDSSACSAPFGAEILQAFATTGRFASIRTTVVAGYYALAGDVASAMRATRGTGEPGTGAVERRVVITTIPR